MRDTVQWLFPLWFQSTLDVTKNSGSFHFGNNHPFSYRSYVTAGLLTLPYVSFSAFDRFVIPSPLPHHAAVLYVL